MNINALKAQIALKGISVDQLLKALKKTSAVSMSRSAFYRKLNGTSEFDRKEILALCKVLDIKEEKIVEIFFKEKVS